MRSAKNVKENKKSNKVALFGLLSIIVIAIIFVFFKSKNADAMYNDAIDDGIEAINDEDYEKATSYFRDALEIEKDDKKAKVLSQGSELMQEASVFYNEHEFDQSLNKTNHVLEIKSDISELDIVIKKAEKLKEANENILADQMIFQEDLDNAKETYNYSTLDDTTVNQILETLNHILAHEQIDEPYHQEIKESAKNLITDVQSYQAEQAELKAAEIAKQEAAEKAKKEAAKKEKQKARETQKASASDAKSKLSGYSALEIEYARIILMVGYPGSPTVYIHNDPAGTAVTSGYEETVKFPDPTVTLTGEYGADGIFVYTPLGDGYIRVYPVPGHWHQDDQSPAGYRAYAQEILDSAQTVYIDPGDPDVVLQKLQSTTFITR